jgi:hypothetical protein
MVNDILFWFIAFSYDQKIKEEYWYANQANENKIVAYLIIRCHILNL